MSLRHIPGGGVTGSTVLNVLRGIRDANDKNAESIEKKHAARASKKVEEITKQMISGKATVDKLEAIEDADERVKAVVKLKNPSMATMLVMYGETFIVKTSKETLRLECIGTLNALGIRNKGAVV